MGEVNLDLGAMQTEAETSFREDLEDASDVSLAEMATAYLGDSGMNSSQVSTESDGPQEETVAVNGGGLPKKLELLKEHFRHNVKIAASLVNHCGPKTSRQVVFPTRRLQENMGEDMKASVEETLQELKKCGALPLVCPCVEDICPLDFVSAQAVNQLMGKLVDLTEENVYLVLHNNNKLNYESATLRAKQGGDMRGSSDAAKMLATLIQRNVEAPYLADPGSQVNPLFLEHFHQASTAKSAMLLCNDCDKMHAPGAPSLPLNLALLVKGYNGPLNAKQFPPKNSFPIDFIWRISPDMSDDSISEMTEQYLMEARLYVKQQIVKDFVEDPSRARTDQTPFSFTDTCNGLTIGLHCADVFVLISVNLLTRQTPVVNLYDSYSGDANDEHVRNSRPTLTCTLGRFINIFSTVNMDSISNILALIYQIQPPAHCTRFAPYPLGSLYQLPNDQKDHATTLFQITLVIDPLTNIKHSVEFLVNPYRNILTIIEKVFPGNATTATATIISDFNFHPFSPRSANMEFDLLFKPNPRIIKALNVLHKLHANLNRNFLPTFLDFMDTPNHPVLFRMLCDSLTMLPHCSSFRGLIYEPVKNHDDQLLIVPDHVLTGNGWRDTNIRKLADWAGNFNRAWFAAIHEQANLHQTLLTTLPHTYALVAQHFTKGTLTPSQLLSVIGYVFTPKLLAYLSILGPNVEPVPPHTVEPLLLWSKHPFKFDILLTEAECLLSAFLNLISPVRTLSSLKPKFLTRLSSSHVHLRDLKIILVEQVKFVETLIDELEERTRGHMPNIAECVNEEENQAEMVLPPPETRITQATALDGFIDGCVWDLSDDNGDLEKIIKWSNLKIPL